MDSLTQCVLGACVGGLCAPAGQRRRGAVYGAAFGTLPDLDVFLPTANPVEAMVTHRSFSHSLLVLSAFAPLAWWLLLRLDPIWREARARWLLLVWLALITHPLLDWCTTYGTQLLWPLDRTPYALSNVFVIDPLYTTPLLLATLVLLLSRDPRRQRRWAAGALTLSTLYLLWGLLAQQIVLYRAQAGLTLLELPANTPLHVAPAPLNTLLWRILVRAPEGDWYEAWSSLPGDSAVNGWVHHRGLPATAELRSQLPQLERLADFSGGWYALREIDDVLWYADLRMGAHPWLAFRFALAQRDAGGRWQALQPPHQAPLGRPPLSILGWLVARISGPVANFEEGENDATPWQSAADSH